jgi:hypothetical protein
VGREGGPGNRRAVQQRQFGHRQDDARWHDGVVALTGSLTEHDVEVSVLELPADALFESLRVRVRLRDNKRWCPCGHMARACCARLCVCLECVVMGGSVDVWSWP